ncbi:testis-expressed protein 43-like [Callorhinchus milii]|uniref:testis-expressed protein 43-like n=1 Tax=Callorhinchus milii TaxID=7868 RepID=UPI001C3FEF30|nr:testis-expressed protein 43-like [Callorhinchus milii]
MVYFSSPSVTFDVQLILHLHMPIFSDMHPCIPRLYVMPWKHDMKNRKLILKKLVQKSKLILSDLPELFSQHQALAKIPHDFTEESLFWSKRERLCHGQDRKCLEDQMNHLTPGTILQLPLSSHMSKHRSLVLTRWARARS